MPENSNHKELSEILREVTRRTPFTNAAAPHIYNEDSLPGNVGGSCAKLCNRLIAATEHIHGEARLHSVLSAEPGFERKGRPGNHVLVVKDLESDSVALDPALLIQRPFFFAERNGQIPSHLPGKDGGPVSVSFKIEGDRLDVVCPELAPGFISPRPWSFYVAPGDRVSATGAEAAKRIFPVYLIRFVFPDTVAQISYEVASKELSWTEPAQGGTSVIKLDGLMAEPLRRRVDEGLKAFDLDITTARQFLREAYDISVALRFI